MISYLSRRKTIQLWLVGQEAKTLPSHGRIMGSIPVRATETILTNSPTRKRAFSNENALFLQKFTYLFFRNDLQYSLLCLLLHFNLHFYLFQHILCYPLNVIKLDFITCFSQCFHGNFHFSRKFTFIKFSYRLIYTIQIKNSCTIMCFYQ